VSFLVGSIYLLLGCAVDSKLMMYSESSDPSTQSVLPLDLLMMMSQQLALSD